MNSEMTDLAREAVACDGWRWMPGMRAEWESSNRNYSAIVVAIDQGCPRMANGHIRQDALPDLESPATLGCLLHLVREVYDDLSHNAIYSDPKQHGLSGHPSWVVCNDIGDRFSDELPTEAHALVAAMKAGGGG